MSKALQGAKIRYTELEKLAYALLMALCKLRHYFLAHTITVPTPNPLMLMLQNKDASGRIGKWAVELAPFDLTLQHARSSNPRLLLTSSPNGPPS